MSFIFVDESGDLGFDFSKSKTSQYFIITFLFVPIPGPIEKIISKTIKTMRKTELKHFSGVLHAHKSTHSTREKLLSLLGKTGAQVMVIILNKKKVYTKLKDEQNVLYNYVTNILLDRVISKKLIPLDEEIKLIASRRETNKFMNENFCGYMEKQAHRNHQVKIKMSIETPRKQKCLQVVDFTSWSIFRNLEHGDDTYYRLMRANIIEENMLFP